ncbi:MAG: chromate efflux transporter [Alphaproteobacteria bacterium]|nr:MAG: chromate efflux transporter [Alphaproteobacteria bacterium]
MAKKGNAREVLIESLRLGLTSFGGPVAHLGYFERVYVREKKWLDHETFSQIVALCQLLPGPASSQVNFLIGLKRAGWTGALLSWAGFTLPSAVLMYLFAVYAPQVQAEPVLHGLKLAAVAVVAQAVRVMAARFCVTRLTACVALAAMGAAVLMEGALAQTAALLLGALAGFLWCREKHEKTKRLRLPVRRGAAVFAAAAFLLLLAGFSVFSALMPGGLLQATNVFYHAGTFVFGGGHVVLPLLHEAMVPAMLNNDVFLAGYGAAQALPGPLFTIAAYLGAAAAPEGQAGLWSAAALLAIFLPGLLLAVAAAPVWGWFGAHPRARGALSGINAAVVGVLAAALYHPVFDSAVKGGADFAAAAAGYVMLEKLNAPPILIVAFCIACSIALRII